MLEQYMHLDSSKEIGVSLVNNVGQITTIVQNHVQGLSIGPEDGLVNAPGVLGIGLSLPCVHGDASGSNGSRSVILMECEQF